MGEVQKWPSKMILASSGVNGPDIRPADVSARSSLSIILGCRSADPKFFGMNVVSSSGGLPIGEPYVMSCTRFGKRKVRFEESKASFQADAI